MGAVISSLNELTVAVQNLPRDEMLSSNAPVVPPTAAKSNGDKEPKWALKSWHLDTNNGVAPWHERAKDREFGLKCAGSLANLFVAWDWDRVTYDLNLNRNLFGKRVATYVDKKRHGDLKDILFDLESLRTRVILGSDRVDFHRTMRQWRRVHRERYIEDERSDDARRKAPTFSKYQRNCEARDYRILRKFGKKEKYSRLSLMGLPSEIRLNILKQLFSTLEIDSWSSSPKQPLVLLRARFDKWNAVSNPLSILLTCRELYFEGHKVFLEQTIFRSRLNQVKEPDSFRVSLLQLFGFGPYAWKDTNYQTMLPNIKRLHIQIKNPEHNCEPGDRITFVPQEYEKQIQEVIEKQAAEVLRDGNQLLELTVDLERGCWKSTIMSDYWMKKYAIDSLLAFTGNVKVMRITGAIPERLKLYARHTEIDIQGYDDTPKEEESKKKPEVSSEAAA